MQPLSAGPSHQHAQTGSRPAPNLGAGPHGQAHGAAAAADAPLQLQPARPQGGVVGSFRPSAAQALPGQAPVLTDALLGPANASQPAQAQALILGAPATDSGALADSSSQMEADVPVAPTPQATLPADPAAAGRDITAAQRQLTCLQQSADQVLRMLADRALPKAERQSQVKGQGCTRFWAPAGVRGSMPQHETCNVTSDVGSLFLLVTARLCCYCLVAQSPASILTSGLLLHRCKLWCSPVLPALRLSWQHLPASGSMRPR